MSSVASLKDITKGRIVDEMLKTVNPASGWKVLVLDARTVRVISACARMADLMEYGVTLVESIEKARQQLPAVDACYFISPNRESIAKLKVDFKDPKKPQYGDVHLFFSSHLPDDLFNDIKTCPPLVSRIKTFKELNLDFLAIEAQSFTLDRKERGFWNLYSSSSQDGQAELRVITNQLATVMTTLKEFPYIRFARERPMCQQVARQVGESLAVLRAKVPDYANGCREQRATLIIVDRSFDALAPVLHDFYYQAMTMDLLEVKNGEQFNYSYVNNAGVTEKKDVLLNEHDKIWPQVRHMHIAECIDFVIDSFNEFLKNNKAAGLSTGKVNDLKGMSEAVRAMPQYKELLAKYSLHIYISQELMKLFNTHGLEAIAGCEQNMAMGEDASGTKIKNVINMITPLLSNASVDLQNKLRLIMIYIITQEGIKTSDRQTLMKVAKIEPAMEATIANLTNLGVRLTKGAKDGKKKSKAKATRRDSDVPFELSRYEPFAKALLYDLTEGTLPAEAFPYSGEQPSGAGPSAAPTAGGTAGKSMRTGAGPKHKWADNRKGAAKEELAVQPRVILFVIGGMTYSEMRVAYEVAAATNHDIFIGSTDTITPSSFLKWVGDLSNADPNSLA